MRKFSHIASAILAIMICQTGEAQDNDNFEDLLAAAKSGSIEANYKLGVAFHRPAEGIEQDFAKAEGHYKIAADANHPKAMMRLGEMYCDGQSKAQSCEFGHALIVKARDAGEVGANLAIGYNYSEGRGVKKDVLAARNAYLLCMNTGAPSCAYNMMALYLKSDISDNLDIAFEAADISIKEDVRLANEMAAMLYEKYSEEKKAYSKKVLSKAESRAKRENTAEAWYDYSLTYRYHAQEDTDSKKGLKALRKAGELGHFDAQKALGVTYYRGRVDGQDLGYARKMLEAAIQQPSAEMDSGGAYYFYGKMMLTYFEARKDRKTGVKYLKIASDAGAKEAAYMLTNMYLRGEIVAQDTDKALEYAYRTRELGHFGGGRLVFMLENIDEMTIENVMGGSD